MPELGQHVLGIPTEGGGKVVLPFLTREQAEKIKASFADVAPVAGQKKAKARAGMKKTCGDCGGAGGHDKERETTTAGGGAVVTTVWVGCRRCKGGGRVAG
ncbi:hypothetical protein [Streptosporangium lutulentum]|uniref:DnaJ-class molecular chaperone n=1 Tax=Streptosporangium lutulentum TaxID=1461250 RepID=A0ABT9QCF8_9ACTN|nr:hypothetical protein [Streptosporangium lutulentum]MDP9844070.1 DnaJ-class molecular chaperone [Streptosporangium lutulentum]